MNSDHVTTTSLSKMERDAWRMPKAVKVRKKLLYQ